MNKTDKFASLKMFILNAVRNDFASLTLFDKAFNKCILLPYINYGRQFHGTSL